ncbi:MAG TPA: energy transducer TonB [Terriglobales bacterium]|nr:energy transducer TonB [Terriglobales bacterium]
MSHKKFLQEMRLRFSSFLRWGTSLLIGLMLAISYPQPSLAQGELARKAKTRVMPAYPELARRMNLRGTVKIMVTVLPNGNLKDTKVMGGNPILVNAAMEALKKWKFEPAQEESSGTVEFNFEPSE